MNIKLGYGTLTWAREERVSDRYGAIYLIPDGDNSLNQKPTKSLVDEQVAHRLVGQRGELVAVVKEARDSTHIGDFFRGLSPSKPEVGEIIVLGEGLFFFEHAPEGGIQIGLSPPPVDARNSDWLNPEKLYRAHEQSVDLFFHPAGAK